MKENTGSKPMLVDKNKIIQGDRAQFDLILSTHFLSINDNTEARLNSSEKYQLADCLYQLLKHSDEWMTGKSELLISTLEEKSGLKLNPIERAEFKFNMIALDDFPDISKLDNPLSHLLSQCRYHLLINSLTEKQFLLSTHPLKQLVDFIYDNLLGFDSRFGKSLMPIYQFVENLVNELVNTPWNDVKKYQQLMQQADRELKRLTERFFRVADRMVSSEAGHYKAQQAADTVNDFMQSILQDVVLPQNVADSLQTDFIQELRIVIVTKGKDSGYWVRLKKLLQTLVELYQPEAQSLKNSVVLWDALPNELANLLAELNINNPQIEQCLDTIKFDFYQCLHNKPLADLAKVKYLNPVEKKPVSALVIEDEYVDKAKSFNDGQWFAFYHDNQMQRVYLSQNLAEFDQFLFINMLGQKIASLDTQSFAYELSNNTLIPMNQNGVCIQLYSMAVDKLLQDFYERYENHVKAKQQADEDARLRAIEEKKVLELAQEKQKRDAEKAQQAYIDEQLKQQKSLQEAELQKQKALQLAEIERQKAEQDAELRRQMLAQQAQLQQQKAQQEVEFKQQKQAQEAAFLRQQQEQEIGAQKQREEQSKRLTSGQNTEVTVNDAKNNENPQAFDPLSRINKEIRLVLDTLSLGARIDLIAEPHQKPIRAKLAVKLAATKRFIFIDHDGLTILDAHRADLIALVLKKSVILLDADARFNQQLAKALNQ